MPQAKVITLDTQEFTPESISPKDVIYQDLSQPMNGRDMLYLNRSVPSNGKAAPVVRVVTIKLHDEIVVDGVTNLVPSTATLRITCDTRSTEATRAKLLARIAQACADADIREVVEDPSWMF